MDEEMLRPFFCTQSLGPFVHPGAKLKGGCETKGGCKAATKPTLYTPMCIDLIEVPEENLKTGYYRYVKKDLEFGQNEKIWNINLDVCTYCMHSYICAYSTYIS